MGSKRLLLEMRSWHRSEHYCANTSSILCGGQQGKETLEVIWGERRIKKKQIFLIQGAHILDLTALLIPVIFKERYSKTAEGVTMVRYETAST